jgi:hypothetical protein
MAKKQSIPIPTSTTKLVAGAVIVAQRILANEEVRRRLAEAPKVAVDWASSRRAEMRQRGPKLTERFGQKGLQHRVDSLGTVVSRVFPDPNDPARVDVLQAVESLDVALQVAAPLPFTKRRKAQSRIDRQLSELEASLVDSVLPAH